MFERHRASPAGRLIESPLRFNRRSVIASAERIFLDFPRGAAIFSLNVGTENRMELKPGKILISEREITDRVESLSREINAAYGSRPVTIVGVLDGCIVFLVDLVKRLTMPLEIVLVRVETYGNAMRPQKEPIITDSLARVAGRNVLIVDDIYDTGKTLAAVVQAAGAASARETRTCVLLEKKRPHDREVAIDFLGLTVPDEFVVGYGLDYAGKYRNLPYVAALEGFDKGPTIA